MKAIFSFLRAVGDAVVGVLTFFLWVLIVILGLSLAGFFYMQDACLRSEEGFFAFSLGETTVLHSCGNPQKRGHYTLYEDHML